MAGRNQELKIDVAEVGRQWEAVQTRIRGEDRNLCVDSMIAGALGTVKCYFSSRDFYLGQRGLGPKDWLSRMFRNGFGAVAPLRSLVADYKGHFVADALTDEQIDAFEFSFKALAAVIRDALSDYREGICGWDNPTALFECFIPIRKGEKKQGRESAFFWLYSNLVRADLFIYYRELELWINHPEWDISKTDWPDFSEPPNREILKERFDIITKFLKGHTNALLDLTRALMCLTSETPEYEPAAFRSSRTTGLVDGFDESVKNALLLWDDTHLALDESCFTEDYAWFSRDCWSIRHILHDFILMHLNEAEPESKRLWIDADAELMTYWYIEATLDEAAVDRIIALANKAAREDWIQRRLKEGYDGLVLGSGRNTLPKGEVVQIENGQFQELISTIASSLQRPVTVNGLTKEGGKALREAVKDKGGPTAKSTGALPKLTQKEVALMFGSPCNEDMVANWEAYDKTNGKRGSLPPSANYNGKSYSYTQVLRVETTAENKAILAAIVEEYKKTQSVKDGIKEFTHFKSEETLARAAGRVGAGSRNP